MRWIVAIGLLVVAAGLFVSLIQSGTNRTTVFTNGTEKRTIDGDPIVTTYWSIGDAVCVQGYSCRVIATGNQKGLFPRNGISRPTAIAGGMVVPFLLILGSGFLVLSALGSRSSRIVGAVFLAIGASLVVLISYASFVAASRAGERVAWPQMTLAITATTTLLLSGEWLMLRFRRFRT